MALAQSGAPAAIAPPTIYLAAYRGRTERALLETYVEERRQGAAAPARLFLFERPSGPSSAEIARLVASLADERVTLAPLRVAWLPAERGGRRAAAWRDLLTLSDPRHPAEGRKRRLVGRGDAAFRIVEAEPASLASMRARWRRRTGGEGTDFADFVARQAELALERAEVRVHGKRYKLPRIEKEDVLAAPGFLHGLSRLAVELGREPAEVRREALACLHELRTGRSPFVLDLSMRFFRWGTAKAYREVDADPAELARLGELLAKRPALILPAHKAMVDSAIVDIVLDDHGLPPPTLFAGINLDFWPIGPLMRKSGRIFLRRDVKADPVYRFVLREYLGYLVERRFHLGWFPEGTRSRTGKLLPPKLGLLTYVVDAYLQGRIEDVALVPVALAYDQVYETVDYAREARGGAKSAEGLRWMIGYLRALRRPFGKAYVRFAEPLSMREALGPPDPACDPKSPEARLALQKLALAVAWRINAATPITGIALVAFALLAGGGRALTHDRLAAYAAMVAEHARRRGQPLADSGHVDDPEKLDRALATLIDARVVERFDEGPQTVYGVARDQHLAAAFYRNSMLHFVMDRAIAEIAAMRAAEEAPQDREAAFFTAAVEVREALKFEFFFQERPAFEAALADDLDRTCADWRERLLAAERPDAALRGIFGVGTAHAALRPFIESYRVIADILAESPVDAPIDEAAVLKQAQGRAQQYLLEHVIRNPEAASRQLFASALQLAGNLRLLEPGPDLAARRQAVAARLCRVQGRLERIEALTRDALAG